MAKSYRYMGEPFGFSNRKKEFGRFNNDRSFNTYLLAYTLKNFQAEGEEEGTPGSLQSLFTKIRTGGDTEFTLNLTKIDSLHPSGKLKCLFKSGEGSDTFATDDAGTYFLTQDTLNFEAKRDITKVGGRDRAVLFSVNELEKEGLPDLDKRVVGQKSLKDPDFSWKFNTYNEKSGDNYIFDENSGEFYIFKNNSTVEIDGNINTSLITFEDYNYNFWELHDFYMDFVNSKKRIIMNIKDKDSINTSHRIVIFDFFEDNSIKFFSGMTITLADDARIVSFVGDDGKLYAYQKDSFRNASYFSISTTKLSYQKYIKGEKFFIPDSSGITFLQETKEHLVAYEKNINLTSRNLAVSYREKELLFQIYPFSALEESPVEQKILQYPSTQKEYKYFKGATFVKGDNFIFFFGGGYIVYNFARKEVIREVDLTSEASSVFEISFVVEKNDLYWVKASVGVEDSAWITININNFIVNEIIPIEGIEAPGGEDYEFFSDDFIIYTARSITVNFSGYGEFRPWNIKWFNFKTKENKILFGFLDSIDNLNTPAGFVIEGSQLFFLTRKCDANKDITKNNDDYIQIRGFLILEEDGELKQEGFNVLENLFKADLDPEEKMRVGFFEHVEKLSYENEEGLLFNLDLKFNDLDGADFNRTFIYEIPYSYMFGEVTNYEATKVIWTDIAEETGFLKRGDNFVEKAFDSTNGLDPENEELGLVSISSADAGEAPQGVVDLGSEWGTTGSIFPSDLYQNEDLGYPNTINFYKETGNFLKIVDKKTQSYKEIRIDNEQINQITKTIVSPDILIFSNQEIIKINYDDDFLQPNFLQIFKTTLPVSWYFWEAINNVVYISGLGLTTVEDELYKVIYFGKLDIQNNNLIVESTPFVAQGGILEGNVSLDLYEENAQVGNHNLSYISNNTFLQTFHTSDSAGTLTNEVVIIRPDGTFDDQSEPTPEDIEKRDLILNQPIFFSTSTRPSPNFAPAIQGVNYRIERTDVPKFKNKDGLYVNLKFVLDASLKGINTKYVDLTFDAFTFVDRIQLLDDEDRVIDYSITNKLKNKLDYRQNERDFNLDWNPILAYPIVSGTQIYWECWTVSTERYVEAYFEASITGWQNYTTIYRGDGENIFLSIGETNLSLRPSLIQDAEYLAIPNFIPASKFTKEFYQSVFGLTVGTADYKNPQQGWGLDLSDWTYATQKSLGSVGIRRWQETLATKQQDFFVLKGFNTSARLTPEIVYFSKPVPNAKIEPDTDEWYAIVNGLVKGAYQWNGTNFDQSFQDNNGGKLLTITKNSSVTNWNRDIPADRSYAMLAPANHDKLKNVISNLDNGINQNTVQSTTIKVTKAIFASIKIDVPDTNNWYSRLPQKVFENSSEAINADLYVNSYDNTNVNDTTNDSRPKLRIKLSESNRGAINRLIFSLSGGEYVGVQELDEKLEPSITAEGKEVEIQVYRTPNISKTPTDTQLNILRG